MATNSRANNIANSSLEKALMKSSEYIEGNMMNWRKLWSPHSQNPELQIKQSKGNIYPQMQMQMQNVSQSVKIPGFASKFYEELEEKYFKTSSKKKGSSKLPVQEQINEAENSGIIYFQYRKL